MGLGRYFRGETWSNAASNLTSYLNPFNAGSQEEKSNITNQIPAEQRELWKVQTEAIKPYLELSKRIPGMVTPEFIKNYQDTLKMSPQESSLASTLTSLSDRAAKPFSYDAYLEPLRREFTETVAPEIRSSALRVGAPGSSGESEALTQAGARYGEAASSAFERARQTENQSIGLAGALAQDAAAGGELSRALAQATVLAPLTLNQMAMGTQPASPQFTSLGTSGTSKASGTYGLLDMLTKLGGSMESMSGGGKSLAGTGSGGAGGLASILSLFGM